MLLKCMTVRFKLILIMNWYIAIEMFDRALAINPNNYKFYINKGNGHYV